MNAFFWECSVFVILLLITGFYCLLATFNLIRALIGIELLIKGITLLLVLVGFLTGNTGLIQALVITVIVIEVVFIVVATGVVLGLQRAHHTLDLRKVRNLKG